MDSIPTVLRPVFIIWSKEFAKSVWPRFLILLKAALLCSRRRTVTRLLQAAGTLAPGHFSTYHRVLSKRRWSLSRLARPLIEQLLDRFCPEGIVPLAGDDTVTEHRGKHVYGKGCHRDAVHSTHSHLAYRWGHKWIMLALLVRLPGRSRPWALPILVALYRPQSEDRELGRRHKTPVDLTRQLLCLLMHWFPRRKFAFSGDGAYGTHALAKFAARHRTQLTLVSRFYPQANLYAPPPRRKPGTNGRPRLKGKKLPGPAEVVAGRRRRTRLEVSWYGGGRRQVAVVTGSGHWYRMGAGLVPVRWVFVEDRSGTHRDEYFFSTDEALTPREIVEAYVGRWSIEVTFEEAREHLGLGTTRGHCEETVLRGEPCLLGLYTLVALWDSSRSPRDLEKREVCWAGKESRSFSDAIAMVRRDLWKGWVLNTPRHRRAFAKLTKPEKILLYNALTLVV